MVPLALAASAVLYSVWTLEFFLDTPIAPLHAYTSELAAFDQPSGWLFRWCDLAAGILVVGAGALGLRRYRHRWIWIALIVFGAATVLDSQWSLSCAPTGDDACATAEAAGSVPLTHRLHTVSSTTASAAALVAIVMFAWTARGEGRLGRVAVVLAAVLVVSTVWTLAAVFVDSTVGLAQRTQLMSFAISLVILAVATRQGRKCFT
nr:DUF998 domain-containing protein [Rhodococcus sp. (in: high G+C Gram-positive bacteria)]